MANVNARRIEDILTNGITADHYIAGSNITITDNSDGTQTISASGGGGGGGNEVPNVTSGDDGKVLTASYSGSTGTYAWAEPSIPSGVEVTSNKVTSLSNASTDTQYPSAKCVYDIVGNIQTVLASLTTPSSP